MVNGERTGHNPYESEQETKERFVRSADRLFGLVDTARRTRGQQFFIVEWGREGELEEALVVDVAPTGARKQERNDGLFSKVQLKVVGEGSEPHFVWARVAAQATGKPIQLDHETLDEDFGYKVLTGTKVSQVLAERTQSLSDYLYLAREMTRRKIDFSSSFQEPALKLMGDLLDQPATLRIDQDSLEGFGYLLKSLNPHYAAKVRHALLSDMLRVLGGKAQEARHISFLDEEEAASFLEAALRAGVIPQTEAFTSRILPLDAVYKHPFATDLLHVTLSKKPLGNYAKTIAGKEVEGFTCRYIATILQARVQYARPGIEVGTTGILQELLSVSGEEDDQELFIRMANLQGAGMEFLEVLGQMRSTDPEIAAKQQRVDVLSAEIVNALLRPVINRKIGREIAKRGIVTDHTPPTI